jgi:hypothetical protein
MCSWCPMLIQTLVRAQTHGRSKIICRAIWSPNTSVRHRVTTRIRDVCPITTCEGWRAMGWITQTVPITDKLARAELYTEIPPPVRTLTLHDMPSGKSLVTLDLTAYKTLVKTCHAKGDVILWGWSWINLTEQVCAFAPGHVCYMLVHSYSHHGHCGYVYIWPTGLS